MVQYGLPTLDVDELEEEIDQLHEVVKEQAAKTSSCRRQTQFSGRRTMT